MEPSTGHHKAHRHHLGTALALAGLSIVATMSVSAALPGAPSVVEITSSPSTATSPPGRAAGTEFTNTLSVVVPARDEIRRQCVEAGLVDECRVAGLRGLGR